MNLFGKKVVVNLDVVEYHKTDQHIPFEIKKKLIKHEGLFLLNYFNVKSF